MSRSKTAPSTLRLSEFARHFVYPPSIERTVWPRVEAKGVELGLRFDWWQSQLGTVCLGYGADGKYRATVGGIGLSIPRQVGKTYFVLAMLVILCILFPGLQVVWTAHHLRTSTKTFTTLRGICRRRKVAPHIKPGGIRAANGEQQVAFANESLIMFGARSMGFGRGFDEIDIEVFDEAQILDSKALDDMIAATNQARHEHGALLFFMGTPPRQGDPSKAFKARRKKAIAGKSVNAVWLEIGADPESDPDDRGQWPLMNPSFPKRTPPESMERLRENLSDEDSWNREGRGIWDADDVGSGALHYGQWLDLTDADAARGADVVFGADVAEDRTASIAVIWKRPDAAVQVMLTDEAPLSAVKAGARLRELHERWGGRVMLGGPAVDLQVDLERDGVECELVSGPQFAMGCGLVADGVRDRTVRHGGQSPLNEAVRLARWRSADASGGRAWQLRNAPAVGPLAAISRAMYGLMKAQPPPPPPMSASPARSVSGGSNTSDLASANF